MILIREIRILRTDREQETRQALLNRIRRRLKLRDEHFSFQIIRHTLDARKKPQIYDVYTVCVTGLANEAARIRKAGDDSVAAFQPAAYPDGRLSGSSRKAEENGPSCAPAVRSAQNRPVIIGAGPAGLFCALLLSLYGRKPLILERGNPIEERSRDVADFWNSGHLDPDSNVQFGEGGAGTFSDGKLLSRIHDPEGRVRFVLEKLVQAGAP
jgi:uncharacterized FAD-dependent dehydrogenase